MPWQSVQTGDDEFPRDRLPVDALAEGPGDLGVAFATCCRNIELVDRRFSVVRRDDLVRAVTISADRGLRRSLFCGAAVYAVLIRDKRLGAYTPRFHQESLPMA